MALGTVVALEAEPTGPVLAGGVGAVLLLSLALVTGRSAPIPLAVYAIPAGERALWAPVYGGGLLLCAELAYWSLESRVDQRVHGDVVKPRLIAVLGVVGVSLPAGALVLLASEADLGRSPALTGAAALAVVACAGLLAILARAAP